MLIITFATQNEKLVGIGTNFSEQYFGGGFPHYRKGIDPSEGKLKYATIPFFLENYYKNRDEGDDWDSRSGRSHNFMRQVAKTFDFDWMSGHTGDGGRSVIPYSSEIFGTKPRPKAATDERRLGSGYPAGNGDYEFNEPHDAENLTPWKVICKCREAVKGHDIDCWFAKLDKRFRVGDEVAAKILAQYHRSIRLSATMDKSSAISCGMRGCTEVGQANFSCVKCTPSKELVAFWCSKCISTLANAGAQELGSRPRQIPITPEASELLKNLDLSCQKCKL